MVYYCWVLTNIKEHTHIYKYNLIFFFFNRDACVEQKSNLREFIRTNELWESEQLARTDFSPNSSPYRVLKLPRNQYAMLVVHSSLLTPIHSLFFIGNGLHPSSACSPFVIAYTHIFLVFPLITLMILYTAGCIGQQHLPGSS